MRTRPWRSSSAPRIPTMIVIKDDRVVDRIVGALPPNDLKMRLFPYLMKT